MKARRYAGRGVICPICNAEFKIFGPYGRIPRMNAECLNCGSLERHRLVWLFLMHKTNFFESDRRLRLLQIAPEEFFTKGSPKPLESIMFPAILFLIITSLTKRLKLGR